MDEQGGAGWSDMRVDKSDLLSFLLVLELHLRPCVREWGNPARETLAVSVGSAARRKK